MNLFERWQQTLDQLRAQGRHRRLQLPAGLDFSSNDYLGLGKKPWPITSAPRSGLASRLLRGHHPLWEQVEAELARWHGAEAALVFSSGYAANEGLLSTLIQPEDWFASDQANHASIIDGLRLSRGERCIFPHNDLAALEEALYRARLTQPDRQMFIITESLFGMEGDRAPLGELADLAERFQAHLLVDEAHATGCFGDTGSGLVDHLGLRSRVLATVHTGGKALGLPGAYVVGSSLLKEYLVNRCRHQIFTTALPPAIAETWLSALPEIQQAGDLRQKLFTQARSFRKILADFSLPGQDYIVPVVLGEDERAVQAASRLQAQGLDVRAIRPPTVPSGTARLRISLHADHRQEDLQALAQALREALGDIP